MTLPPDDTDLLPPRRAAEAIGMPAASYQTLHRRGQLVADFYGLGSKGQRLMTRRGALALALYRAMTERGIEIPELSPGSCLRWADYWLRTRSTPKPIHTFYVRYYGEPNADDTRVSLLPNPDVLSKAPAPGAEVTVSFDLDAIFGRAEAALRTISAAPDGQEVFELSIE